MDVYQSDPFYTTNRNSGKDDINLPKHWKFGEVARSPQEQSHITDERL